MSSQPFSPVFHSPFSEGDEIEPPAQSFFILQEQGGDKILLESGDAMLTEMAM